jgi:hypothetical protein
LIDAIVESEYTSSCHVSSGETRVFLAYVIADMIEILTPLHKPTAAFTVFWIATSTASIYNDLKAQRCCGLPDMAKR